MQINFARSLAVAVITSAVAMSGVLASPFQQDDDGVIEGFVFLDDDGDGVLDIAEVGVDGIIVRLDGAEKAETETDAAGGYRFGGLEAGKYDVTVETGEDYATAELDSYRGLVLQKDGDGVETLGDVNFALRDADMEAATTAEEDEANAADDDAADTNADSTDEDATADAADAESEVADTEDADTEDADAAESDDEEDMSADEADAADDEDAAGGSTDAMSLLLTQMIGDMSGEDADGELRASLEAALASAEADGTDNEMTAAIQQALAAMDADADDAADAEDDAGEAVDEAADGDEDSEGDMNADGNMDDDADGGDQEDSDANDTAMGHDDGSGHDGDMADAGAMTKGGMAVDATGGGPEDMPDTGAGGPISIALLLMLGLALVAGLGRGMERRLGA